MSRYGDGGYGGGGTNPYANGYGAASSGSVNPYGGSSTNVANTNPYGSNTDVSDRYGVGAQSGNTNPYGDNPYGASSTPDAPSSNLYGGGYGSSAPSSQPQPPPQSAGRREGGFQPRNRRQGGYGAGAMSPPSGADFSGYAGRKSEEQIREENAVHRPVSLERSQAKRRSGGPRSPQRRINGNAGPGSQQIEDVLKYIQRDWEFMTDDRCIPVEVALKLMDDSSLGLARRHGQFKDIHEQLQTALKAIVNEHHQGFNSSIGTFHSIQSSIQNSQVKLRTLRDSLVTAKGSLSTSKPELRGLANRSQEFDDMLQVLASIEHLQAIPEKLEAKISEKRFLGAVEILQDGLKTIRNSEMDGIGALSDLRVYLSNQEHSLTDIMVEELHNHLYLKSPYCESRWKQYAPQHMKATIMNGSNGPAVERQLFQFLDKMDTSKVVQEDTGKNPEIDSFSYVQLIIEALNSLGRLDTVVESITQRLPVELFKVVDKSTNEADQRHPASLRGKKAGIDAHEGNISARSVVLNDLLGSLFARFEAIAEGHRVVHEVISGILKREGMRSTSALTSGFRELWKLYQSEIRTILHDYLATDGESAYGRDGVGSNRPGSVFSRNTRDRNKQIFKLNAMDAKSSDLSSERTDLESILKTSVPGLVSDAKRPSLLANGINGVNGNGNGNDGNSATGHKLLVEPSVFNMGILLPPSLGFLTRLKDVVPSTSDIVLSTLTSFLDDFLVNVFLPQLEETLTDLCAQSFIEADAFVADPSWSSYSKKPIFKGTVKFFKLIEAFCRMLDRLPHDQAFSHLVITQIMTYYEKCHGWYRALIARAKPHPASGKLMKMGAALVEDESEFKDTLNKLASLGDADDKVEKMVLMEEENELLLKIAQSLKIEEADLMHDMRNIASMCTLHTSMKWLATKTQMMRHISTEAMATDSSRRESRQVASRRWTLVANHARALNADSEKVYLPLNDETAVQFDAAVGLYRGLAVTASKTLHVEVRCRVIHHIEKAMRRPFVLDAEVGAPDPEIVSLNADLVSVDEVLQSCLQESVRSFILTGLSTLLTTYLLSPTPPLTTMNQLGCKRLTLNILVLRQNLKNVEPGASLHRAASYYDLFALGSQEILKRAKEQGKEMGFSGEEVGRLLRLCYSEALGSERREVSVAAERGLAQDELLLSEYLY